MLTWAGGLVGVRYFRRALGPIGPPRALQNPTSPPVSKYTGGKWYLVTKLAPRPKLKGRAARRRGHPPPAPAWGRPVPDLSGDGDGTTVPDVLKSGTEPHPRLPSRSARRNRGLGRSSRSPVPVPAAAAAAAGEDLLNSGRLCMCRAPRPRSATQTCKAGSLESGSRFELTQMRQVQVAPPTQAYTQAGPVPRPRPTGKL